MGRRRRGSRPASGEQLQVSVTGLVTYEVCPKQYYYTQIVPLRPPFQRALERGTSIHSILENLLRGKPIPAVDQLPQWARPYLQNFLVSRFSLAVPLYIEKPFRLELPGGIVRGRMDTVFERQEEDARVWEIVDFKSGRPEHHDACEAKLQGKLYALAARELWQVPRVTWSYFYLADGSVHSFELDTGAISNAAERAGRALEGIKAGRWEASADCSCWVCRLRPEELARGEAYWRRRAREAGHEEDQPSLPRVAPAQESPKVSSQVAPDAGPHH